MKSYQTIATNVRRTIIQLSIVGWVLAGIGCQDNEVAVPTLEDQFVGNWMLNDLNGSFQIDGEDLLVYVAQVADSLGLPAQEVAIAVVLLESRAIQEILNREPNMVLSSDRTFEYLQSGEPPLVGSWQLSADERQLLLTPQADSLLVFSIISFDKTETVLELDEEILLGFDIPNLPEQINAKFTMTWHREETSDS